MRFSIPYGSNGVEAGSLRPGHASIVGRRDVSVSPTDRMVLKHEPSGSHVTPYVSKFQYPLRIEWC